MYDPSIGRWLSEDPLGFEAGDSNLYRYVGNGPTNATDPSGLLEWVVGEPVGGKPGYRHFYVFREFIGWNRPATMRHVGHLNERTSVVERGNRAANRATIESVGYQDSWDAWFHDNGWQLCPEPLGPRPAGGILLDQDHARRADMARTLVERLFVTTGIAIVTGPALSRLPLGNQYPLGRVASNPRIAITGFGGRGHAINQAITRGVSPQAILSAIRTPTVVLEQGTRNRWVFLTRDAAVVIARDGQIVTIWGRRDHSTETLAILRAAGAIP